MGIALVGIDLAKNVFQLHEVDEHGKPVLRRRVSRSKLLETVVRLPACRIVLEACGGAHYWARRFMAMGHQVQMIAPKFVKPTCPRWIEHLKLSSRHCAGALGRQVPLALAEPGSLADRSTIGHVLLRDPNLPEAMLPLDWPGRTARGLCHTLYGALLDVSEAYLHRVVEVADGSLLDANRSLRLRFGAGAQAADGN